MKAYLAEAFENFDVVDCPGTTFEDGLAHAWKRFDEEANYLYNLQLYPNEQERLTNWIAGLPLAIDYTNTDIVKAYKRLHETDEIDDRLASKVVEGWFSHIALFLIRFRELEKKKIG